MEEMESVKPRRLDPDSVRYLTQLESQINAQDLSDLVAEVLVENVLDEIKLKTASAACDRHTNGIIERLCHLSNKSQAVEICSRMIPYISFLVENRFSSHVLQVFHSLSQFVENP